MSDDRRLQNQKKGKTGKIPRKTGKGSRNIGTGAPQESHVRTQYVY
ncbi:hypothetical protein [Olivibacter sitiensis]|nr:hypothetical protein [Olivibacter sitiensis]